MIYCTVSGRLARAKATCGEEMSVDELGFIAIL